MPERIDLGHGVFIEPRKLDGELAGLGWWHPCTGGEREDFIPLRPKMDRGWDVIAAEPLTIFPSVLCRVCKFHGYITKGKWYSA
jgi:Family of unknown function (DUF6527)